LYVDVERGSNRRGRLPLQRRQHHCASPGRR